MNKIGLFFGTYNPIHNGHLMMANFVLNHTELDKIEFVVSPNSSFKKNDNLINFSERCKMIEISTLENKNISYNDCEIIFNEPTFTYDTVTYLSTQYPNNDYSIIIGADNLMNIETWHKYEEILKKYTIYVCPRNGLNIDEKINELISHVSCIKSIIQLKKTIECNISSTFIRNELKNKNDISFYVPEKVKQYILKKKYYQ